MIIITRSLARLLRAVLRKAGLGKIASQPDAWVHVESGPNGLRLRVAGPEIGIEYRQSGEYSAHSFILPVEVLALVEGRTQEPITLTPTEGQVSISFTERGVPQLLDRSVDRQLDLSTWPELPTDFKANAAELWPALRDAVATTDREATRYALNCLQLRGRGEVAATDGHHVLIQSGFDFPWPDDLLVPAKGVLGCKELDTGDTVQVGIAGDWVTFGVGPWLISLKANRTGRFPQVHDCVPPRESARSHLLIASADAEFVRHSLPSLPSHDAQFDPITLDLNGRVIIRAQGAEQSRTNELVLSNSRLDGEPVRLNSNRKYLARALNLGFREFHITKPNAPVLCQDERRRYIWALLDHDGVLNASDDAIVTASPLTTSPPIHPVRRFTSMNEAKQTTPVKAAVRREQVAKPNKQNSPLEQAIALRDSLRNAATAAHQLIRSLKQHKRESRIVATTLASLKQLQKAAS